MKKISLLMLLMLLKSVHVVGCPELAGEWSCDNSDQIQIAQELSGQYFKYNLTHTIGITKKYSFLADGQDNNFSENNYSGKLSARCESVTDLFVQWDLVKQTGQPVKINRLVHFYLQNGLLKTETDSIFEPAFGMPYYLKEYASCSQAM